MGTLGVGKNLSSVVKSTVEIETKTITVTKPVFEIEEQIQKVVKPKFELVEQVESVTKPAYKTVEVVHIVQIPKPDLQQVDLAISKLTAKIDELQKQIPQIPKTTTEIKEVIAPKFVAIVVAINLIGLGALAWLLN